MPGRLRVFISSTMDDLESERDLLANRLKEFNFEPVNAEAILPNGASSWDRISEELETCHVFLLLIGNRYGWIPTSGSLAAENISVTHGEYRAAVRLQLPILPFLKILKYTTSEPSQDAQRRDAFRKEISDWDTGHFRSDFTTARDLADKASEALTRMLSDNFQRDQVARRREVTPAVQPPDNPATDINDLPVNLINAVAAGRTTFWAGSGISLRAGLPSAALLATEIMSSIRASFGAYTLPSVGSGVASVASDLVSLSGRPLLLAKLRQLLDLPGGVIPTPEHEAAIALFPTIITTNYDTLFERAAGAGAGHEVTLGSLLPSPIPEKLVWKIHGSMSDPESIVITEDDIAHFEQSIDQIVETMQEMLKKGPLLVGETSLRDPSILKIFQRLRGKYEGYWSVPRGNPLAIKRARELGLQPVEAPLSGILKALQNAHT